MFAAQGYVFLIPANFDLRAIGDDLAIGVLPDHHRGFTAAMADRANFTKIIGNRK